MFAREKQWRSPRPRCLFVGIDAAIQEHFYYRNLCRCLGARRRERNQGRELQHVRLGLGIALGRRGIDAHRPLDTRRGITRWSSRILMKTPFRVMRGHSLACGADQRRGQ